MIKEGEYLMKLLLNESMQLTKKEKQGGIIFLFIVSLIMIIIGELILLPFGFGGESPNPTMMHNLMGLFQDIVPIILVIFYCKFIEKRTLPSLGITQKNIVKNYGIGLLLGSIMIYSTFAINLILGSIFVTSNPEGTSWLFITLALFGYLVQGFNEELICRGFLMNSISARKGPMAGIILNSLFFAALHLLNSGTTALSFINIFLVGMAFSLIFYKTNSLWVVVAMHSILNFFQGPVFGIQVSGLSSFSSVFKPIFIEGKEFINGGAFGFEGGLAVTVVMLITVISSLVLIGKQPQKETFGKSI